MTIKTTLFIEMSSSTTKSPSGGVGGGDVGRGVVHIRTMRLPVTVMRAEAARCSPIKAGLGGCGQPLITPPGISCTASWGDSGRGPRRVHCPVDLRQPQRGRREERRPARRRRGSAVPLVSAGLLPRRHSAPWRPTERLSPTPVFLVCEL